MTKFPLEIYLREEEHDDGTQMSHVIPVSYVETFPEYVAFYGPNGHGEILLVEGDWSYDGYKYDFLSVYPAGMCD
jgi:hypothetical protein